jgi:hypothetical protein
MTLPFFAILGNFWLALLNQLPLTRQPCFDRWHQLTTTSQSRLAKINICVKINWSGSSDNYNDASLGTLWHSPRSQRRSTHPFFINLI